MMTDMLETSEQKPVAADEPRAIRRRRLFALSLILLGCVGVILILVSSLRASASQSVLKESLSGKLIPALLQEPQGDFTKFSHTQTHSALPCLLCHRRENNNPRLSLPGHTPCAGCHAQRFSEANGPICTICHTDVYSHDLKPFPSLKSFKMKFDHALHLSGAARPAGGCATCHQATNRGVALLIPAGFNAHATCFQCHTARAQNPQGRDISSCSTCHVAGTYARTSMQASAYRVSFSHARHTARQGLSCNDCHNARAGMPQGRQVTAPQALMHHASPRAQSCLICHNNKRAFGIENFADCKKCHQVAHFYF